ncbi:hypothetical protein QR680_012032 [Steinernema hermaphroditum]|uniref:Uncharacterized protein n=1 Tax=Steinernema hermaphroditum TaxID=289476 RepID=A0AA39M016_9BILA|nr:hypothetical protein QR680_012032 [Steinernema hermaphroditum]
MTRRSIGNDFWEHTYNGGRPGQKHRRSP